MKYYRLYVLFFLLPCAFAGTGRISGTVVDESGAPVPHITVEISPVGMAWGGGIPRAETDDHGHFQQTLVYGRWAVYPLLGPKGYYPDMSSAFYTTVSSHAQIIELTPESPEAVVNLKLGPKAGALVGHVTDVMTGKILHPEFDFAWTSGEPNKRLGIRTGDPYRILLPANTDIKLVVQCEGYQPWTYPGVIDVGPGQDMKLDIKLDPIAAE